MAHSKVAEKHMTNKILECPRDGATMAENHQGESILDVCGKCGGQFFDTGEMFGAFGMKADPALWDRDETSGAVREGKIKCPRCNKMMLMQDVKHDSDKVEIDRCGHCGGIWLDKGEVDTIMSIGAKMKSVRRRREREGASRSRRDGRRGFLAGPHRALPRDVQEKVVSM